MAQTSYSKSSLSRNEALRGGELSLVLEYGVWAREKAALTPGEARAKQRLWTFFLGLSPAERKKVRRATLLAPPRRLMPVYAIEA